MVNYNNALIYKLCCKDTNIKEVYIGSTCNFRRRKCQHKSCCISSKSKSYNMVVYEFIRKNGGWDNWDMVLIEKVICNDKLELKQKERVHIEKTLNNLNRVLPSRTQKEWVNDNREHINNRNKNKKLNCDCGSIIPSYRYKRHCQSKNHIKYINK